MIQVVLVLTLAGVWGAPSGGAQPIPDFSADQVVIGVKGKADAAVFEPPKDFKKAASLKDVLPSDPFLDDED